MDWKFRLRFKRSREKQHLLAPDHRINMIKMKIFAIFLLTLLCTVMTANARPQNCRGSQKYKLDLYSVGQWNYYQTTAYLSIFVPRCSCVKWPQGYREITNNIQKMNTFGKRFCAHTGDSCRSSTWKFVKTYGSVEWVDRSVNGLVYSIEYCDK